jgi:hypothetical protein
LASAPAKNTPQLSQIDISFESKGMFTQRLYRSLGLVAHLGWARLLVDRDQGLIDIPAPTRKGPGGGRHHFASDDEGPFEHSGKQVPKP